MNIKYLFNHIIRLINKQKRITLLLVLSLFVGFTSFIFISAKISYHKSFDKHFKHYKNIYRIISRTYTDQVLTISQPRCQRALGKTLESRYPEILKSGYLCKTIENHFNIDDIEFTNDKIYHCSESFIKLFSLEIIQGDTSGLLSNAYKAIISESFAKKYFGDDNPVGKIIHQFPAYSFEIEGVYKDLPTNSHFQADVLISLHDHMLLPPPLLENWGEFGYYTYLILDEIAEEKKIEQAMAQLTYENNQSTLRNSNTRYHFELQPLENIHTQSHLKNELTQNIRGDYLTILELISLLIFIASGFNYVYFSHTRIINRSKPLGIKKLFGARNSSFISEFLLESVFIHLIALTFSFLVYFMVKQFSPSFTSMTISDQDLTNNFWIKMIIILLVSSLLNPIILSLIIRRKKTLTLLAQNAVNQHTGFSYRQFITFLQFFIVVALISVILGIDRQISYLRTKDQGMNIQNKLVIKTPSNIRRTSRRINNPDSFEQELKKMPRIQNVSISNNVPGDIPTFSFSVSEKGKGSHIKIALVVADNNFLKSYNIAMLGGSNFPTKNQNPSDILNLNNGCVVNAACLKRLGYYKPEEIISRNLVLEDESSFQEIETYVTGVCSDFNFISAKDIPGPVILIDWTQGRMWGKYTLTVHSKTDKKDLLSKIESHYHQTFPGYSFEYFWVEDYYNEQFSEEISINRHLKAFTFIAILLGMLSMFSMVWHISLARTKEIGIRKVNGAKKIDILEMLNIDFLKWIILASLISIPVSWYFLSGWLKTFSYKVNISPWIFIIAMGTAILIGIITVTWQTLKVAGTNPVDSIRYE